MILVQEHHMILIESTITTTSNDIFQSAGILTRSRFHCHTKGFIFVTAILLHCFSYKLSSDLVRAYRLEWPVFLLREVIFDSVPAERFSRAWCGKWKHKSYEFLTFVFLLIFSLLWILDHLDWLRNLFDNLRNLAIFAKSNVSLLVQDIAEEKCGLINKGLIFACLAKVDK